MTEIEELTASIDAEIHLNRMVRSWFQCALFLFTGEYKSPREADRILRPGDGIFAKGNECRVEGSGNHGGGRRGSFDPLREREDFKKLVSSLGRSSGGGFEVTG